MTDQSPLSRLPDLSARLPEPDVLGPLVLIAGSSGEPLRPVSFDILRQHSWLTAAALTEALARLAAAGWLTCSRSGRHTWIQVSPYARVLLARANR